MKKQKVFRVLRLDKSLRVLLLEILQSKNIFEDSFLRALEQGDIKASHRDLLRQTLSIVGDELAGKGFDGDSPNKYGQSLEDIVTYLSSAIIEIDKKEKGKSKR